MTHNYRCTDRTHCGKRVTLVKRLELYRTTPVCPDCGGRLSEVTVKERARTKRRLCRCDGAWYPHRKGGVPLCQHAPAMDEDDAREAYRQMLSGGRCR